MQYTYRVKLKLRLSDELMKELGITMEDMMSLNTLGYMPLTKQAVAELKKQGYAESIELNTEAEEWDIYPLNGNMHWTRDNYGPVWIPKKGESIDLNLDNIAIYERPIRTYEGNDLMVKDNDPYNLWEIKHSEQHNQHKVFCVRRNFDNSGYRVCSHRWLRRKNFPVAKSHRPAKNQFCGPAGQRL